MGKKNVVSKVAGDLTESTRKIHEINKANLAAVCADTKANFEEATKPDPGMEKVKAAKGFGGKVKAIAENIKDGARENTKKEKKRREKIQNHDNYNTLLENQRKSRKKTVTSAN